MYEASPECHAEYFARYPAIVEEIKETASSDGFAREYIAEELNWRGEGDYVPSQSCGRSSTIAAKYLARGVVTHLVTGVTVGLADFLATAMAHHADETRGERLEQAVGRQAG
jgi:hypothetical protein